MPESACRQNAAIKHNQAGIISNIETRTALQCASARLGLPHGNLIKHWTVFFFFNRSQERCEIRNLNKTSQRQQCSCQHCGEAYDLRSTIKTGLSYKSRYICHLMKTLAVKQGRFFYFHLFISVHQNSVQYLLFLI